jgi:hypothetical protein
MDLRELSDQLMRDDGESPETLEEGLRRRFPNARVYRGISDGVSERWYVYRDGHWVRGQ